MMIFLTLLFTAVSWASPSAPDEGWKKVDETDGVTTSIRDVKGSPFIGVKGEGVIDAPISVVASVVDDMPRYKDWVDHLESSRWLHRDSPWNYVEWDKFKMPFPLQDRDFVTRAKVEVRLHPLEVIARVESVDDPLAEPEYKHYIRGEVIESYYIAREIDATHTFLIGELHADPKGWIPAWLMNLVQRRWPLDTFRAMRRQCARTDIPVLEHYRSLGQPARR